MHDKLVRLRQGGRRQDGDCRAGCRSETTRVVRRLKVWCPRSRENVFETCSGVKLVRVEKLPECINETGSAVCERKNQDVLVSRHVM